MQAKGGILLMVCRCPGEGVGIHADDCHAPCLPHAA